MYLKILFLITSFLVVNSCSANVQYAKNKQDTVRNKYYEGQTLEGLSSYYGEKFHGRKTANGDIFDMYKLTAAHRFLPFGTILEVINISNRRSVRVRVNDRGPFAGNRILDLSYGAARKIDMVGSGVCRVKIRIIHLGKK